MPEEQQLSDFLDNFSISNRDKINNNNIPSNKETNNKIRQELFEGDLKTKAFFSYKTFSPSLDANGSGYQWTEYDSIPGHDAWDIAAQRFGIGDITNAPVPSENNTYYLGIDYWGSGRKSMMYSPVLAYDTTIEDKVHYIFNMHRDLNDNASDSYYNSIDITFKIILWHYHTSTQVSTEITSVAYLLPKINTPTDTEYWEWLETNSSLTSYTIPAGDRFKLTYETAHSDVGATQGHTTLNIMEDGRYFDTGISGTNLNWNINDGVHSNSYTVYNVDGMLGVQLYMIEENTPDIDLYNAANNTIYYTAQEMTIDVTDGSVSKYRWDGGSWSSFSDSTLATLPASHEWHNLEIVASDPIYNNTRTNYFKFGYDASVTNFELHAPYTNGSIVESGLLLNFSAYYLDTVTYEWDSNGTQFPLVAPYDITLPVFEFDHNLTIRTTDFYSSAIFTYFFTFDSDLPLIQLDNVINGSTYAPLKTIDVEISDFYGIKYVKYHWDSNPNSTWTPESGNIYRTNLPITDGNHFLYVFAYDNIDHPSSKMFYFYADSNVFLVELQNLTNNSYYQGGETVKITIQKSNGTVRYSWDGNPEVDGSIILSTLTLEGIDGIPLTAGSHHLTITTYDSTDIEFVYYFNFIVDLEAPVIDSSISGYNNSRYKTDDPDFVFAITDNYVSVTNLTVLISVDGKANKSLTSPFVLILDHLDDGNHYFYLYAIDIAGNADIKYIFFVIDTLAPQIEKSIAGLVVHIGQNYIPGNSEVQVSIEDDDPSVVTEYSWNGSPYTSIIGNSFFLPGITEAGTLAIRATDSNLNSDTYYIDLIIDVDYPTIYLPGVANGTKVNFKTELSFEVRDYVSGTDTIEIIEYTWDNLGDYWFLENNFDFFLNALPIYVHDSMAEFYVYVQDIVGNSHTYTFSFLIDIEAPVIDLQIYDASKDEMVDASEFEYLQGDTAIEYNVESNDDLAEFLWAWNWDGDDEKLKPLNDSVSWTIYTKEADGSYNLTVILKDNTLGAFPNTVNQTFSFKIDNIALDFVDVDSFTETTYAYVNSTSLIYGDFLSFVLTVTNALS
ncbi:MAG: hypothetical protein H7641_02340, partial [Candidatus Heimdallarchaeota archaeon]|nr:hypothetical protein [Candidatus Heimdallarchaeota archaeon]MCK4876403.1 hypothetical protein [Candidatus Heimdallarchaeota archaeon]